MIKRYIIALTLGVLLSVPFVPNTSASHIGFTINGQPGIECVAPCTVEVYDPDGGSYQWDFEGQDGSFDVQATGNPVSWTYQQAGGYTIIQWDGTTSAAGSVNVIPAEDSAPEDIELVSPASGKLPLELEFTTIRREVKYAFDCYPATCRGYRLGRTGPDGSGRYHHYLVVTEAPDNFELTVEAWNTSERYAVRDQFPITVTGRQEPFVKGKATWRVQSRGRRCVIKFTQRFKTALDYQAKLKLVVKEPGLRGKNISKKGGGGSSRIRGKVTLTASQVTKLPVKIKARLKVTTAGKSYVVRDAQRIKAGCA